MFVAGVLHMQLLDECRKQNGEAACQVWADRLQGWLDTLRSPGWQRALKVLGEMAVKQEASVPLEEVDQELVDGLDQVITFLSPFATKRSLVSGSVILDGLRQILQQKADGTLLDPPPADATVSATRHV